MPNNAPEPTPLLPGFSLVFPPRVVPTGKPDGSVIVTPGKPVLEDEELTIAEAEKALGGVYKRRTLQKMAKSLNARQRGKRCKLRIPAREIARLKGHRA